MRSAVTITEAWKARIRSITSSMDSATTYFVARREGQHRVGGVLDPLDEARDSAQALSRSAW